MESSNSASLRTLCWFWMVLAMPGCTSEKQGAPLPADSPASVARLQDVRPQVTHRKANELVWNTASEGIDLANYDSIRTGGAAAATIVFHNKSSLQVGEKTLMIVLAREEDRASERSVVAMPSGKVGGSLPADSEKPLELVVRTSRGWIQASNRGEDGKRREVRFDAEVGKDGALTVRNSAAAIQFVTREGSRPIDARQSIRLAAVPGYKESESPEDFASPPAQAPRGDSFRISEPKNKAVTSLEAVRIRGEITGRMRAFLNGQELIPQADGSFERQFPLELGVNLLTFQVVGPKEDDIRYITREVTRK